MRWLEEFVVPGEGRGGKGAKKKGSEFGGGMHVDFEIMYDVLASKSQSGFQVHRKT